MGRCSGALGTPEVLGVPLGVPPAPSTQGRAVHQHRRCHSEHVVAVRNSQEPQAYTKYATFLNKREMGTPTFPLKGQESAQTRLRGAVAMPGTLLGQLFGGFLLPAVFGSASKSSDRGCPTRAENIYPAETARPCTREPRWLQKPQHGDKAPPMPPRCSSDPFHSKTSQTGYQRGQQG